MLNKNNMSQIHILVDWSKNGKFFLEKELDKLKIEYKIHHIPNYNIEDRVKKLRIVLLYWKYIKLALFALKETKKGDVLICWNFTTSIALGYLSRLFFMKRRIIALNIIAHRRNPVIDFLRKMIFYPSLKLNLFYITVNSEYYINGYAERFNIGMDKFFVLPDVIQRSDKIENVDSQNLGYVFVGGEAKRDWQTLFDACKKLHSINFVCIARRKYFDHSLQYPNNVKLLFDTDNETFYTYISNASIVVLPLSSQLPCGLIVLLKSALMKKSIIITSTPSTRNYIKNDFSGILIEQGNSNELVDGITKLYDNSELQDFYSNNLYNFLLDNFSEEMYAQRLIEIINKSSI